MRGTGLDSPLWIGNWGRTRPAEPPDVPPNQPLPFWPFFQIKLPTLDREDKLWLAALVFFLACTTLAATGPWG